MDYTKLEYSAEWLETNLVPDTVLPPHSNDPAGPDRHAFTLPVVIRHNTVYPDGHNNHQATHIVSAWVVRQHYHPKPVQGVFRFRPIAKPLKEGNVLGFHAWHDHLAAKRDEAESIKARREEHNALALDLMQANVEAAMSEDFEPFDPWSA